MAYSLASVTIRTDNTVEGIKKIDELWKDIESGSLPILFDTTHKFQVGVSPVSMYSNYASDETGEYDLSILAVKSSFFGEMEKLVSEKKYQKYDVSNSEGDLSACAKEAWTMVWNDTRVGNIVRVYTKDYESTVPAMYTKDGKAHCYLYIAIK